MDLTKGTQFGPYLILGRLGRGANAAVYKARLATSDRPVAVKVLTRHRSGQATSLPTLTEEVSKLNHPSIATVLDQGIESGLPYTVREFVEGSTLSERLGKAMPVSEVIEALQPIAEALDYAHAAGIVHRDLKPNNIVFRIGGKPILMDFGLSSTFQLGGRKWTPSSRTYLSPEQVAGLDVGPAADRYSLGAIAYEMLTGKAPTLGLATSTEPIDVRLAPAVGRAVLKAVAPEPGKRFGTAVEMIRALAATEFDKGRVVNVCLVDRSEEAPNESANALPPSTVLRPTEMYALRIDIGRISMESVVVNAPDHPFPPLPTNEEGPHWLEVVATSDRFQVSSGRHWMVMPKSGPSWVCPCPPDHAHTCRPDTRKPYLFITVTAPNSQASGRIRISIYYRRHLVQSMLLKAQVGGERMSGAGYSARIDYSLAGDLDVASLPARSASILTNQNADNTHTLIINGAKGQPLAIYLTEGQIRNSIEAARQGLRDTHYREFGGSLGAQRQRENLLGADNEKKPEDLTNDLKRLAPLGWNLWNLLLGGKPESVWAQFRIPSTIQIGRTAGSTFVFPWAMVYDIPLESSEDPVPCSLLSHLDQVRGLVEGLARVCPYDAEHQNGNVLCPFGFWGFRHLLEQPPSMPLDWALPTRIQVTQPPAEMVAGISLAFDETERKRHLESVDKALRDFHRTDTSTIPAVRKALAGTVAIAYFYCHGGRDLPPGATEPNPFLQLGSKPPPDPRNRFFPSDVVAWRATGKWPAEHWKDASPLVFINGCHTVELTPEALVNFVDCFANARAAGVIGTEISVDQHFAGEAAERFFRAFRPAGATAGKAVMRMRLDLLEKHNLLGLAYTPYCSTDLMLQLV